MNSENEQNRAFEAEPWARLEEESNWEYAGFQIYRNAGPARTLQMAAEGIAAKRHEARMKADIAVAPSSAVGEDADSRGQILREIEQWARRNDWSSRSEAWDADMQEQHEELARCEEIKKQKIEDEVRSALSGAVAIPLAYVHKNMRDPEKNLEVASLAMPKQLQMAHRSARLWTALAGFNAGAKGRTKSSEPDGSDLAQEARDREKIRTVLDQIIESRLETARLARNAEEQNTSSHAGRSGKRSERGEQR